MNNIFSKIIFLSSLSSPYSAYANRLMASVSGFMENGVEVEVLLLQSSHEVESNLTHAGIPFVNLSGKQGSKHLPLLLALCRLIPYLRRENVFLIHITKSSIIVWCFLFASRKTFFFMSCFFFP